MLLTRSKIDYLKKLDGSLPYFGLYIIIVGSESEYTPDMLHYDSLNFDNNKYNCIRFVLSRYKTVFKEYTSFAQIRSDFKILYELTHLPIKHFPAYG